MVLVELKQSVLILQENVESREEGKKTFGYVIARGFEGESWCKDKLALL